MNGHRLIGGVGVLAVVVAALAGGCGPDPKERIAMLEDQSDALTEQLNRLQNERAQLRGEYDVCQQELTDARGESAALRQQLTAEPEERVPEGWTAVPGGAMIAIEGQFLFDSGKATIQKGSTRILDLIASTLQNEYPSKDVLVFGHTDDMPIKLSGWKDNWELSAQRSLAVVRHLGSHGIDQKRLVACGCGEHRARVPNESDRNRQKNRRVEIFVLNPQPRTGLP